MTGYVMMHGICLGCRRPFTFHPNKVPSHMGQPVCEACMATVNARRRESGLGEFPIQPGAYEPAPEEDVDWDRRPTTVYPIPPDEAP